MASWSHLMAPTPGRTGRSDQAGATVGQIVETNSTTDVHHTGPGLDRVEAKGVDDVFPAHPAGSPWAPANSPPQPPGAADMVMKSRAHHDSKYRAGVPVMFERSSEPLVGLARPVVVDGW
jgi:hypothetical protein